MKKYYKVVKNVGGKYWSAILGKDSGVHFREYFTDKFATPSRSALKRGYLLTCFDKKKHAADFFNHCHSCCHELWEVDICGRKITYPELPMMGALRGVLILSARDDWPEGTVMAEKVRLAKKVWSK